MPGASGATSSPDRVGFDRRWLALGVTTIGSFMSILDSTVVNIALPSILKDFHANLGRGQLVLTIYLLSLAIVIPISGFLGDRVGMKRMYMITLAGFTITSALCGLAWGLPSLIAFRALQGVAGGMLQPLGMAMVFTMITPLERGRFMAILGLPMLLGPLVGPTVGGYLVQYSSWRLIFFINLPIGILNLFLAKKLLSETIIRKEARLDHAGFALATLAFPGIILGLSEGSERGWTSPLVLGLLLVGSVSLFGFIMVELKKSDPLLQLRLFANRMFTLAMIIMFISSVSLFGIQYLLPLYLQRAHGIGAAETGLVLLPSGFATFAAMNIGGRLYNRLGPRPLAIAGLAILFVGTVGLANVSASTSLVWIGTLASIRGIAMGIFFQPVQTAAFNTVAQGQMARATALMQVSFRIFSSASTAILTTILLVSVRFHGAPRGASITDGSAPLGAVVNAFQDAFLFMTVLTVVTVIFAFFIHDPVIDEARAIDLSWEAAGD